MAKTIDLQHTLRTVFGFQDFRPGQREAISLLLNQKRLLCIQPTGYGKSLLYQLPASLLPGITLVISPLLALMRDQIKHLGERFHIPAAAINTDQTEEENAQARLDAAAGKIKVLFIAPEQLDHVDRFNFLLSLSVDLFVVDEAHCISTWGHDFRPSYRLILQLLAAFTAKRSELHVLALTATADLRVEEDIKQQLTLFNAPVSVLREAMDRPNIRLSVLPRRGLAAKLETSLQILSSIEGCGLIYCATRDHVELVAEFLQSEQMNAAAYHAGFEPEEKQRLQQDFLLDRYKALVATNALGMGIDKSNLRFIIHFDMPGSITAYYQEVGRCGRDGLPAQGILLFDPADRQIQQYFIDSALPAPEHFEEVLQAIETAEKPPNLTAIKRMTGLHPTRVTVIIAELVEQRYLEKKSQEGLQVYVRAPKGSPPLLTRYERQQKAKKQELANIFHYGSEEKECRMQLLRKALGDPHAGRCGHCDVCKPTEEIKIEPRFQGRAAKWLDHRPCLIAPTALHKIQAGITLFDNTVRSHFFIRFMKERSLVSCYEEMDGELISFLLQEFGKLKEKHGLAGIIPIPSRTWKAQNSLLTLLSSRFQLPIFDILQWKELPPNRQGELLNNDQRHYNIHKQMEAKSLAGITKEPLVLFDDYIGSGNTFKEAGRALRAHKTFTNLLIPFTITAVQWHLGKPGFIPK